MSREATGLAPEIAVTIADDPGLKSANRIVSTRPPPAQKKENQRAKTDAPFEPTHSQAHYQRVENETQSHLGMQEYRSYAAPGHKLWLDFPKIPANC